MTRDSEIVRRRDGVAVETRSRPGSARRLRRLGGPAIGVRDRHRQSHIAIIDVHVLRDSQQSPTFHLVGLCVCSAMSQASGDRPSHRERHPGTSGERPLPRRSRAARVRMTRRTFEITRAIRSHGGDGAHLDAPSDCCGSSLGRRHILRHMAGVAHPDQRGADRWQRSYERYRTLCVGGQ